MSFPSDFAWGAASAAYQIEGGALEDGKGPSIWDEFSHLPGRTFNGQTGDIAADAYHRFEEDLDIMRQLGLRHYRFSLSWPRIFPDGMTGPSLEGLNPAGIAYYDKLVDGCLDRGITPWVTLYHWDLPLALSRKGGWLNRETAEHFARYAAFVADHFRGRVTRYVTVNEPQCAIGMGHGTCLHAPGIKLEPADMFLAWHNMLLAHGLSVREIRSALPDAVIGVASTGALTYLSRESCRHLASITGGFLTESGYLAETPAALSDKAFLSLPADNNPGYFFNHQWFLDPVFLGHYPEDPHHPWTAYIPDVSPEDMALIAMPVDFAGLNIYNGHELVPDNAGTSFSFAEKYPGYPRTSLKWPVTPEVLYWGPRLIWERYGKPVCITENGQACFDRLFLDGAVHDPARIDFLHRYLRELKKACGDGVPVQAYFHWSLTDNYEWHSGYEDRFGLIFIDYMSQKRIPKDSASWYAGVVKNNGETL